MCVRPKSQRYGILTRCAPGMAYTNFSNIIIYLVSVPGTWVGAGDLRSSCNEESFIWTTKMKFVTIYASVKTCIIRDKNQTTVEFRPLNYRRFLRAIKSQKKSPYRVHFSGMKPFQTGPGTPEHLPGKLGAGPFNPPNRGICRDLLIKRHRSGFLST